MGRKLDALLGRTFKTSKFKTFVNLAISRLAVVKNQRQVRCSHARSDVAQLLDMGQHERALLRADHVIKEQNMFDAFVMMEGYCNLLIERVALIEHEKECPEELKEAVSGLIFAASRCGEFPELQEIREIFSSKFGKEFTAAAVNLRNQCGVNPKMIQKMSTRQPSFETKLKVTKDIAFERGITIDMVEPSSKVNEEDLSLNNKAENMGKPGRADVEGNAENKALGGAKTDAENAGTYIHNQLGGSMQGKKYADIASAAKVAFESAAQAAEAARAALELSKSKPNNGFGNQGSPGASTTRGQNMSVENHGNAALSYVGAFGMEGNAKNSNDGSDFEKVHPLEHSSSESDDELVVKNSSIQPGEIEGKSKAVLEASESARSLNSTWVSSSEINPMHQAGRVKHSDKVIHFDESDEEIEKDRSRISLESSRNHYHLDGELNSLNEVKKPQNTSKMLNNLRDDRRSDKNYAASDELSSENEDFKTHRHKQQLKHTSESSATSMHDEEFKVKLDLGKRPISVRNRRVFKH